uniref:Uncharacterized protein n=1 Tax=Acrobeloides nanus TaxID=290746 RepID=A0A914BY36_9BILA
MASYIVYPVSHPVLDINLSTQQGRQNCYDAFTLYLLKVERYYHFNLSFALKVFGNKRVEQTQKDQLISNLTTSTYKVLREVFLGSNWMATDLALANNRLNQILESITVQELYDKLGVYLKEKQQKALLEPPSYEAKVHL